MHSVEKYVQVAVAVATQPQVQLQQYREAVCADRHQLLGPAALAEAVDEWHSFLYRAVGR